MLLDVKIPVGDSQLSSGIAKGQHAGGTCLQQTCVLTAFLIKTKLFVQQISIFVFEISNTILNPAHVSNPRKRRKHPTVLPFTKSLAALTFASCAALFPGRYLTLCFTASVIYQSCTSFKVALLSNIQIIARIGYTRKGTIASWSLGRKSWTGGRFL